MKKLSIGTDCSGIEAPIQALKKLKIPFEHKFCSDIDKHVIESIKANYSPNIIYNDITKRDHSGLPDIDMYISGFPCQPYSSIGLQKGTSDSRSNVMLEVIKVIKIKKPKVFVLENVKNFKTIEDGKIFKFLINSLEKSGDYKVFVDILNTKEYGIPQNRNRLFIIGILKESLIEDYKTPKKINMKKLDEFLTDKSIYSVSSITSKNLLRNLKNINYLKNVIITNFNFKSFIGDGITPTLTTRCGSFFHTTYNRYLLPEECLALQGFPKSFKKVVSNTQLYRQAGNSMSINVLEALLKEIFRITKM